MSYLIPGVDLLSVPCITKSDVQQAIAQATPVAGIGFVIVSDSAPDVVTYPELAYFIWLGSTSLVPNGTSYYYNGSSWSPLVSQDGSTIDDNSIPLSKINRAGSAPYNIIQVNAAGNGLQWISVVNAITNGSIPLAKLVGGAAGNFFFASLSGVNSFLTLASIVDYLNDNTIPIMRLVRGPASAHGLFLRTFEDGSIIEWADFDANEQIDDGELYVSKLSGNGFTAGQAFRRNQANSLWEAYDPTTVIPTEVYDTNAVVAATQDIVLTKPNGRTWKTFEISYIGSFDDNGTTGPVSVAFTWQTAPIAGTVLTPGAAVGCGNSGQQFVLNNNDDTISPTWLFKGNVPTQLVTTNAITLRATITLSGTTQSSGVFMGKGLHNA